MEGADLSLLRSLTGVFNSETGFLQTSVAVRLGGLLDGDKVISCSSLGPGAGSGISLGEAAGVSCPCERDVGDRESIESQDLCCCANDKGVCRCVWMCRLGWRFLPGCARGEIDIEVEREGDL